MLKSKLGEKLFFFRNDTKVRSYKIKKLKVSVRVDLIRPTDFAGLIGMIMFNSITPRILRYYPSLIQFLGETFGLSPIPNVVGDIQNMLYRNLGIIVYSSHQLY